MVRSLWIVAVAWLVATPAFAANTAKPRVSPSFLGGACLTTIEQGTAQRFEIGIPFEDADLTEDEPADSRTFQFFGLCRDPGPLEGLPMWIDQDDVMRAQAANELIEDPDPEDVLASATAWAIPGHEGGDCVVAMTAAADRMPITCAATRDGFGWDGSNAPPGAYSVYGYTFEPDENIWTGRRGVVRVVPAGGDAGPAVAFSFPLSGVEASLQGGVTVAGCYAGAEGTTVAVSWALAAPLDEMGDAAWQPVPEVVAEDGVFEAAFAPPPEAEYQAVFFRAVAEDGSGRSFASFTHDPVVIVPACEDASGGHFPSVDACDVGAPGDWSTPAANAVSCDGSGESGESGGAETGSTSGASSGGSGTGDGDTDPPAAGGDDGCGCRGGAEPPGLALLLVLVGSCWRWSCRIT